MDPLPLAVAAVLLRQDRRYLLIRRAEGIPAAGYWSPPTGRPEPGESLERAVEREVGEEVGLAVRAVREVHRCPTNDGRWLLAWFEVEAADASALERPLVLAPAEVAEARWATASEALLLSPMFPATRRFFSSRNAAGGPGASSLPP